MTVAQLLRDINMSIDAAAQDNTTNPDWRAHTFIAHLSGRLSHDQREVADRLLALLRGDPITPTKG